MGLRVQGTGDPLLYARINTLRASLLSDQRRFTEAFQMGSATAGFIQAGSFLSFCFAAVLALRLAARPRLVVMCAGDKGKASGMNNVYQPLRAAT